MMTLVIQIKPLCVHLQIQQDTSDELAKAIRELEASTAALQSCYGEELTTGSDSSQPVNGVCDSDSYTSKSSLQCSSGYGTMASTPASSEDAIASGGEFYLLFFSQVFSFVS